MEESETEEVLSHSELVTLTTKTLNALLGNDPLLSDLPQDVTLDEVSAQIALQQGSALSVKVVRADGEVLRVVVERQGATLGHLKRAIRRHVELRMQRDTGRRRFISWRHVWKSYWLSFNGEKLKDDNATLVSLGIINKSRVTFVKRNRDKQKDSME